MPIQLTGRKGLNQRLITGLFSSVLLTGLAACGGAPGTEPAPVTPPAPPVVSPPSTPPSLPPPSAARGVDDVVVVAVIDSGINPYHWDYLAAKMPQALNSDGSDDLPLFEDPASWLPGHPGAEAFKSYQALNLSIDPTDPAADTAALAAKDAAEWGKIVYSEGTSNDQVSMYWMPGTKIIGHVAFSPASLGDPTTSYLLGPLTGPVNTFAVSSHGIGTSSVAAGNIHGSCPNCLIVYVHGTSEQANEWVAKQDWIDAQTNSWGLSLVYRDRAYAGSDTELQREAVERGQSIFFSAGNGQENAFLVPNTTLQSSQEGPDWLITVGAVDSVDSSSPSGHGKPADIASVGDSYPSATGGDGTATAEGSFGGTSNATPVTAGLYAEALYRLRRALPGPSRVQKDGVIAISSNPLACGSANADCALKDGQVTVHELRESLFRGAQYSGTGWNLAGLGGITTIPGTESVPELELLAEGHGHYRGRMDGEEVYQAELARITGFADGSWFAAQDPDQMEWMRALSFCTQSLWGPWDHGYWNPATNSVPPDFTDPTWPVRAWLMVGCPTLTPLIFAERLYAGYYVPRP